MLMFDRTLARLLLEICRFTYADASDNEANAADKADAERMINEISIVRPAEFVVFKGSSSTSFASIAAYPDKNVVAYMGTLTEFAKPDQARQSLNDWLQNFRAAPVPFSLGESELGEGFPATTNMNDLGGLVHAGFLDELRAIQATVVTELLKRGGRARPVCVTGHSQGGAEAALATRALLAAGFPVVAAYTFAAPRAGNKDFIASVPESLPIFRIEFGDDIVPHAPPRLLAAELEKIAAGLKALPFLDDEAKQMLDAVLGNGLAKGYAPLGKLCYGSNKTKALRVGLSEFEETALFADRLFSLARHPERWADHHHLAGTKADATAGVKGNYTALVSDFVQLP